MDEGAFSRGICEERRFLINLARKKFRISEDDAEDFAHDTLLKAWAVREHYQDEQHMRAWLVVILCNKVFSNRRRAWRMILEEDMAVHESAVPGSQFDTVFLRQVLRAMLQLPVDQIDAIILIARGSAYGEAGAALNAPAGTVKSRLSRGRKALRELVE